MWLVAEKEITVKHAGKSVTVAAGQSATANFQMRAVAISLDPVVTTTSASRRAPSR